MIFLDSTLSFDSKTGEAVLVTKTGFISDSETTLFGVVDSGISLSLVLLSAVFMVGISFVSAGFFCSMKELKILDFFVEFPRK